MNIAIKEMQINEEIRDKELRVIMGDGEVLGIMSADEALKIAEEKDLDLVKIAPHAVPPVCKIMDYGKYRFEQEKKLRDSKKNQKLLKLKEIRMQPKIGSGDLDFKSKHVQEFLAEGNKVKVTVRFRGRELAHTELENSLELARYIFKFAPEDYKIEEDTVKVENSAGTTISGKTRVRRN